MRDANSTISKCSYCGGEGWKVAGHYDAFHYDCRFCEGTGVAKFKKCKNCNKYGEVGSTFLGTVEKCENCDGTAMVLIESK